MNNTKLGRLAMRVEGDCWNAYYAEIGTMKGALFLGSIKMAPVMGNVRRKDAFVALMQGAVSDMIGQITGAAVEWPTPPVAAPESERGGRA